MTIRLASIVLILALAALCGLPADLKAQPPASPATGSAGAPSGPLWTQTLQLFDEWAAIQQLYTPEQARQWRAQILSKAAGLPPADSQRLAADLNQKLQVMLSAEARDARKWLAETLAVASDSYAKEIKAGLPDPRTMTSGQIQARLDEFEGREANVKQVEASLQKTRQMQVQAIEADQRAQAAANAAAWQGGGGSAPASAYNPAANQRVYGGRYYPPMGRTIGAGGFFW